jgi:hypothetical protein
MNTLLAYGGWREGQTIDDLSRYMLLDTPNQDDTGCFVSYNAGRRRSSATTVGIGTVNLTGSPHLEVRSRSRRCEQILLGVNWWR